MQYAVEVGFQAASLLLCVLWNGAKVIACVCAQYLPRLRREETGKSRQLEDRDEDEHEDEVFYQGTVYHQRRQPVTHSFQYKVRMAWIDLDYPPESWSRKRVAGDLSLTANQVRAKLSTNGSVKVLTIPQCCGYIQNPISVYYAYDANGKLEKCIAEVTNTPWSERVLFSFQPGSNEEMSKCLHVSPFMDMQNRWQLSSSDPGERLLLSITVHHPDLKDYFVATFDAKRWSSRHQSDPPRLAWDRYSFMPQRVAVWIYYQALVLVWKGVPVVGHPTQSFYRDAEGRQAGRDVFFYDMATVRWPWRVDEKKSGTKSEPTLPDARLAKA